MEEQKQNRMDADELFEMYMYIMCDREAEKTYRLKSDTGEGIMRCYKVANGIELVYSGLESYYPLTKSGNEPSYIEIMYLVEGHADFEMNDRRVTSADKGDICIFNSHVGARKCSFGSGGMRCVSIIVLMDQLEDILNRYFETNEFKKEALFEDVIRSRSCICFPATAMLENIFSAMLHLPPKYGNYHRKLLTIQAIITLLDIKNKNTTDYLYFSGDTGNKVHMVRKILGTDISSNITVEELSGKVHLNRTTLQRVFRQMYGVSIFEYRTQVRMQEAKNMLLDDNLSVTEIASLCGYSNPGKFSAAFKKLFGTTPTKWRSSRRSASRLPAVN